MRRKCRVDSCVDGWIRRACLLGGLPVIILVDMKKCFYRFEYNFYQFSFLLNYSFFKYTQLPLVSNRPSKKQNLGCAFLPVVGEPENLKPINKAQTWGRFVVVFGEPSKFHFC